MTRLMRFLFNPDPPPAYYWRVLFLLWVSVLLWLAWVLYIAKVRGDVFEFCTARGFTEIYVSPTGVGACVRRTYGDGLIYFPIKQFKQKGRNNV